MTVRRSYPVVVALMLATASGANALQMVHSERSLYRQVFVYEEDGTRCLCFTRQCTIGRQSCMELAHPNHLVFEYTHMMLGSLLMGPRPQNILIIGLGGGSLPSALATLLPDAIIDAVEIDSAVVKVARQYFGFDPGKNTHVFEEDGRTYVRRATRAGKRYDLVMLDAYDHEYIPEHLLTREFLTEVRSLLNPGGVVAANTFSLSRLYSNESATYRAVFGQFYNLKASNRVILTRNGSLPSVSNIKQYALAYDASFKGMGFSAPEILRLFSTSVDWDSGARVLTDQYSPANLLNSSR